MEAATAGARRLRSGPSLQPVQLAVGVRFELVHDSLGSRFGSLHGLPLTYAHYVRTLKEWDEASKAGINFRKHGVRMPEAIPVFQDPYAITITDDESDPEEQRFVALGMGAAGRLLVVVFTWRGENIRIISARPAEAHERDEYEAER